MKKISTELKTLCNRYWWNGDAPEDVYLFLVLEGLVKDSKENKETVVNYLNEVNTIA